jgi:hypothetical protein
MKVKFAILVVGFGITMLSGFAQVTNPETIALTNAAQALASMSFDSGVRLTTRVRVTTVVWPERSAGMILVEAIGTSEKYAFSMAGVPAMAKQGLTRFTLKPGDEVIVTGVLANGSPKIGPGASSFAARADLITNADGAHLFDRTRLPVPTSK